jgi:hypothetical protein
MSGELSSRQTAKRRAINFSNINQPTIAQCKNQPAPSSKIYISCGHNERQEIEQNTTTGAAIQALRIQASRIRKYGSAHDLGSIQHC